MVEIGEWPALQQAYTALHVGTVFSWPSSENFCSRNFQLLCAVERRRFAEQMPDYF